MLDRFRAYTKQKTGKGGDKERVPVVKTLEDKKEIQTTNLAPPDGSYETDKVVVEQLHNLVTTGGSSE